MTAIRGCYPAMKIATARVIAPFLLIGGCLATLVGVAVAVFTSLMPGVLVVLGGIAGIGMAHIIELLIQIEGDLAAIRARVDSGVLGLLRI